MVVIARQFIKFNFVFVAAAFVTLSLFYFMQFLIRSDGKPVQEAKFFPVLDSRMPIIDEPELPPFEKPDPIENVPPPPDSGVTRDSEVGDGPSIPNPQLTPYLDPPAVVGGFLPDSSMVPLIRTPPVYPTRALQRGIEGFVVVSFTVDELGRVVNPSVVYGEPAGMFDRSALQTIVKWKYAAKIEDGTPIPVHDVQQRITYEMRQ
jgi:protein TonB